MTKLAIALSLFILYAGYSLLVYTKGTETKKSYYSEKEQAAITAGKQLYQQYNCQSCHQLYGLGGYLGPDLTTAFTDRHRGEAFLRAMLQTGGSRMPDFRFTKKEIDHLIAYLKYVDASATPLKTTGSKGTAKANL